MSEAMRWFPFYVDRFLTSKRVRRMDSSAVGAYILLLCEQWDNGVIADDEADLVLVARAPIETVREVLRACFRHTRKGWRNDALEDVRAEQVAKLKRLTVAARAGAEARWKKGKNANRIATALRPESDSNAIRLEEIRKETPRATRARGVAMPNDWTPNGAHLAIGVTERVDVTAEATRFRDWALAGGKTYRDWDAAFRNWLRRARELNGNGSGHAKRWEAPVPRQEPTPPMDLSDAVPPEQVAGLLAEVKAKLRVPQRRVDAAD